MAYNRLKLSAYILFCYILAALLVLLCSCGAVRRNSTKTKQATSVRTETAYRDTGSTHTITRTEYVPYYDTITKQVIVVPRYQYQDVRVRNDVSATARKVSAGVSSSELTSKERDGVGWQMYIWVLIGGVVIGVVVMKRF